MEAQATASPTTQPESTPVPDEQASPVRLKAGRALAVLALYIIIQLLIGFVVGVISAVVAASQGANLKDPQAIAQVSQYAMPLSVITGVLIASIISLFLSARWFPQEIQERSPTGAAWAIGKPGPIILAFGIGLLIALAFLFLGPLMSALPDKDAVGPLAKMASTPGFQRSIVLILGLLLAPPVEELLFRGVLFGGLCRSFGASWSAILVTVLFVVSHVMEAIHFWPAFVAITLMASAALWFRLRTRSIGPSIALHFSYNLIIFGSTLLAP